MLLLSLEDLLLINEFIYLFIFLTQEKGTAKYNI